MELNILRCWIARYFLEIASTGLVYADVFEIWTNPNNPITYDVIFLLRVTVLSIIYTEHKTQHIDTVKRNEQRLQLLA